LARTVAALPVVLRGARTDWEDWLQIGLPRPELIIAGRFEELNAEALPSYMAMARWACLPWGVLAAVICWRWARAFHQSMAAGIVALSLWCFSPLVLANSAPVGPDTAAAGCGVLAGFCFWKWLREPTGSNTAWAMASLGLAQISKFTWVVLFPLWIVLWFTWNWTSRRASARVASATATEAIERLVAAQGLPTAGQLAVIVLGALWMINAAFAFDGCLMRLGDYKFESRALAGKENVVDGYAFGNRFRGTWLEGLPVPLPRPYVAGIDVQKVDFERRWWQYLNGRWERRGWWYYYLESILLREPLGTLLLGLLALGAAALRLFRPNRA
jgi:hypothetical protein